MKLITLWEPWATLMAIGAKKIETRHWSTHYRGWLAIHAAKRFTADEDTQCWMSPFREALNAAHIPVEPYRSGRRFQFPLGCIIAVTKLVGCVRTGALTAASPHLISHGREVSLPGIRYGNLLTKEEYAFGNYEDGRYGLITAAVFRLPSPVPFKSRQGMLLDVPQEIVVEIQKQWRGEPNVA